MVEYYEFDGNLLHESAAPKVEAGQIVVNNLTYQGMKMRLVLLRMYVRIYTTISPLCNCVGKGKGEGGLISSMMGCMRREERGEGGEGRVEGRREERGGWREGGREGRVEGGEGRVEGRRGESGGKEERGRGRGVGLDILNDGMHEEGGEGREERGEGRGRSPASCLYIAMT